MAGTCKGSREPARPGNGQESLCHLPKLMTDLLTEKEVAAVEDILMEELEVKREQLTLGAALEADLAADSLTKVEIVMRLEDYFRISIADEEVERVETVGDVYDAVARVLGRR